MKDGTIEESQITVPSAFNNDFSTYGGHQARLNKRTWPPGYRGNKNITLSWIKVEFNRPVIVTSIATQGYGDDSVAEWITRFYLLYADLNSGQAFKASSTSNHKVGILKSTR